MISVTLLISLLQPVLAADGRPSVAQERQSEAASASIGDEKIQDPITTEGPGIFAAENTARRLEFSRAGLRYLSKLNQTREPDFRYRLTSILAQGDGQFSEEMQRAVRPKRNGNEVYYFRSDALVEKYRTIEDGVEQSFVIQQSVASADQDVILRGEVATGFRAEAASLRTLSGVAYLAGINRSFTMNRRQSLTPLVAKRRLSCDWKGINSI